MKIAIFQSIGIACFWGTAACAGLLGPSNFDECVTDAMKGVRSDYAARQIDEACQRRFPGGKRPGQAPRSLSLQELTLVTGSGGSSEQNVKYFAGSVYNGNRAGTIKTLTIYLLPKVPAENFHGIVEKMDATEKEGRRRPWESVSLALPLDDIARQKKETEGHLRYYRIAIEIPPLSTRSFSVQVLPGDVSPDGYEWGIAEAEVE